MKLSSMELTLQKKNKEETHARVHVQGFSPAPAPRLKMSRDKAASQSVPLELLSRRDTAHLFPEQMNSRCSECKCVCASRCKLNG